MIIRTSTSKCTPPFLLAFFTPMAIRAPVPFTSQSTQTRVILHQGFKRKIVGRLDGRRVERVVVNAVNERDGAGVTENSTTENDVATYDQTPGVVKAIVGGLTAVVNFAAGNDSAQSIPTTVEYRDVITPEALLAGVEGDFTENGYLWTGEISEELYTADCVFTDPTLTFQGLDTFKRNIENLKPWLDRLLASRDIELFSCELDEESLRVRAKWRMQGDLRLPWTPRIDLTGQTDFYYDPEQGGRIFRYLEQWDVSALEALGQILKPASRAPEKDASV